MAFTAATAVEALKYNFRPYAEIEGVTPEPSSQALDTFFNRLREMAKEAGADVGDDASETEVAKALTETDENVMSKMTDTMLTATVELTAGNPTRKQLDSLPFRVQHAFFNWLLGELMDPIERRSATKT